MSTIVNEMLRFQKSELRKTMRGHLNDFTRNSTSVHGCSANAQKRFLSSDIYAACETLLAFISIETEPGSVPLITKAVGDGKLVAVPRVLGPDMEFFRLNPNLSLDSQLITGCFGIGEPDENTERVLLSDLQGDVLVMVPGLSFSTNGKRLGKGRGYYDRFLAELCIACRNRVIAVGYCFDFQIRQHIPAGSMDMPMDYVITDKRVISC
ncbi:MAG: 5-formyltetrahydrofolate cyclo-ligase [Spirochaetaceae bacterium]|jgi:5-formyltetrahydrofolate cyclo-ligase|nr:5-formyltetrahydrofolate cyclo-ligase [Spirochaetaceae bacterium]